MATARSYRDDLQCPHCGSNWMPKDGHSKGRQVYHCGDCGRRYIPEAAYHRPAAADKERAMAMYREGSSLSAIGRIFGASAQAVSVWVKKGGRAALSRMRRRSEQRNPCVAGIQPAAVIAWDEMWTYQKARRQGKRPELWVWTAVVEETDGRRWADFEVGKGGAVNWNEGLHSECRTRLNRLGRRTKGYTKSRDLLGCSLALVLEGWTAKPNASLC